MFTLIFCIALLIMIGTRLWLSSRQIRHVLQHRAAVPGEFADRIQLDAHQKAADYTAAKVRLSMIEVVVGAVLLVVLTLLGGIHAINVTLTSWLGHGYMRDLALFASIGIISGLVDMPFGLYRQFVLEERFGFNKMTIGLFFTDLIKSTLIGAVIGLPVALAALWLMESAGTYWWLYTWLAWMAFNLLMLVLYPTVIAPLFNKFEPLADQSLKTRIENLLTRCGFAAKGLFVMDGSRRSAHGNAYFTGFGAAKRIVFFDTLIERLSPTEIEAVLAHELGHFKHKHVVKRIVLIFALSFIGLALLGFLKTQTWFFTDLGVMPAMNDSNNALALLLFFMIMPVFTFFLRPISARTSRKQEFEADAFAASKTNANDLISALVKLYQDNASTLTPDPVHSAFYDSHPPASVRIGHLKSLTIQHA